MCNINIVSNLKGKKDERVPQLMNTISWLSYDENSDGEGFLKIDKQGIEIGRKLEKVIFREPTHTIVSHQRWATSGAKSIDYTHPFETKDLIVFHNGVMDCAKDEHSDTYIYAQTLQKHFEFYKGDIKQTIEETHKEVSGSYSIVLYVKSTKQLLYYKNGSANFYYARFNNYLVCSTNRDNVEYACKYLKYNQKKVFTPIDHKLYDILDGFKAIADLEITKSVAYDYPDDDAESIYGMGSYANYNYPSNRVFNGNTKDKWSGGYDDEKGKWADTPLPHQRTLSDMYWFNKEQELRDEEVKEFLSGTAYENK